MSHDNPVGIWQLAVRTHTHTHEHAYKYTKALINYSNFNYISYFIRKNWRAMLNAWCGMYSYLLVVCGRAYIFLMLNHQNIELHWIKCMKVWAVCVRERLCANAHILHKEIIPWFLLSDYLAGKIAASYNNS